jgi:hypothetical protein
MQVSRALCPTQLTLILTEGARRSSQMSSLKRGLDFARAHRVPCLGKPSVNGRCKSPDSVGSVCMSPLRFRRDYAPAHYHRKIINAQQGTLSFSISKWTLNWWHQQFFVGLFRKRLSDFPVQNFSGLLGESLQQH